MTHTTLVGLFWMFMGSGAQALLQLLFLLVLARLVSPADFGVVSAAQVVVAFSQIFSQLGVGPAVVQRARLEERHLRAGFTLSLLFGAAMSGIVALLAPWAAALFRMEALAPVVRVLSVVFVIQGASVVGDSLLQRDLQFRRLALLEALALAAGYGAVGVGLALRGWGVWALVAAQIAHLSVKCGAILIMKPHPKRPTIDGQAMRDLLYFGGGFTVARIGNYVASQVDQLVVGRWLGAEALGIYGRAYQLMAAPAFLFGNFLDRVLFPAMARTQDSAARLAIAYRRSIALIALVILPASAVMLVLAPEVIRVLLGPAWVAATLPFQIFAAGMLFRSSYKMSDALARATGAVYRRAWRQVVYALLVAAGAWVGQNWGLAGVAAGVLLAITVNFLLMAHLSLTLTGLRWADLGGVHMQPFLVAVLAGAGTWGAASLLRDWGAPPLVSVLIIGALVLLAAAAVLRFGPRLLGSDGVWMLRTVAEYVPRGNNPLGWTRPGGG